MADAPVAEEYWPLVFGGGAHLIVAITGLESATSKAIAEWLGWSVRRTVGGLKRYELRGYVRHVTPAPNSIWALTDKGEAVGDQALAEAIAFDFADEPEAAIDEVVGVWLAAAGLPEFQEPLVDHFRRAFALMGRPIVITRRADPDWWFDVSAPSVPDRSSAVADEILGLCGQRLDGVNASSSGH